MDELEVLKIARDALDSAQQNIAPRRPLGSSDPESAGYDHDAFMWDHYQRAIDLLAYLADGHAAHQGVDTIAVKRTTLDELLATLKGMVELAEAMNDASDEGGQLDSRYDAALEVIARTTGAGQDCTPPP